jgi:hypothetical protein
MTKELSPGNDPLLVNEKGRHFRHANPAISAKLSGTLERRGSTVAGCRNAKNDLKPVGVVYQMSSSPWQTDPF